MYTKKIQNTYISQASAYIIGFLDSEKKSYMIPIHSETKQTLSEDNQNVRNQAMIMIVIISETIYKYSIYAQAYTQLGDW